MISKLDMIRRALQAPRQQLSWTQRSRLRNLREWQLCDGTVVTAAGAVIADQIYVYKQTAQIWFRFLYEDRVWSAYTLPGTTWLACQQTYLAQLRSKSCEDPIHTTYRCERCGRTRCFAPICRRCRDRCKTERCVSCGAPRTAASRSGLCVTCSRRKGRPQRKDQQL